jgi:hypothetical protein
MQTLRGTLIKPCAVIEEHFFNNEISAGDLIRRNDSTKWPTRCIPKNIGNTYMYGAGFFVFKYGFEKFIRNTQLTTKFKFCIVEKNVSYIFIDKRMWRVHVIIPDMAIFIIKSAFKNIK